MKDCTFTPCAKVDCIWHNQDFTKQDVLDIAELKSVWGQEVEEPQIVLENISITQSNLKLMGKNSSATLKVELPNGVSLIKFRSSEEEYEKLLPQSSYGSVNINVLGTCKINEWNGIISPQIEVKDYEIVGETKYYF